jgi:maleylpyruvate isomerase
MFMKLYNYFRSSASYRVRIALHYKGLPFEYLPVHLTRDGGQQHKPEYLALNPQGLVPLLVDDGHAIGQSVAMLEYLEETHPQPPLLPEAPLDRAYVRAIVQAIACDIHPLNNLRVLAYVKNTLNAGEEAKNTWYRYWCKLGLQALEQQVIRSGLAGDFCFGNSPTMADVCLVPQWANAQRFETDLSACPTLAAIVKRCEQIQAFADAAPAKQIDAE